MQFCKIRENAELAGKAAQWFNEKWGIPLNAYEESITACLKNKNSVPQWYTVLINNEIAGGAGVIENDFHSRTDLTPNVCAVYIEEKHRGKGIAGKLLQFICNDMHGFGINTLYLVTDHTGLYERYGWEFLCMVNEVDTPNEARMYIHKMP